MGRDKALIAVGGTPMVVRVAEAMWIAGAREVLAVGREPDALASFGLVTVPDGRPGAGPVAGIVTALARAAGDEIVLVVGCDLVAPSPAAMGATLAALAQHPTAAVAVPVSGGRTQWHHAAWRPSAAPALEGALAAGTAWWSSASTASIPQPSPMPTCPATSRSMRMVSAPDGARYPASPWRSPRSTSPSWPRRVPTARR
jgi:molybdopterin-guanine dinucleotide biosynthesis protein A